MDLTSQKVEELYTRQKAKMLSFLLSKIDNMHRAEEIVQEAFVRLWQKKEAGKIFNDDQHVEAWLMQQAKSLMVLRFWSNSSKPQNIEDHHLEKIMVDHSPSPLDELIKEDNLNELRSTYKRLKPNYLRALHLFYFNEMKLHDIAKEMGTTQKMVSFMISKGRKILREFLPAR